MKKLWILKPKDSGENNPWSPWYDKAFGFVVIAETEQQARELADADAGDENGYSTKIHPWLDAAMSTCEELTTEYSGGIVMKDFHAA